LRRWLTDLFWLSASVAIIEIGDTLLDLSARANVAHLVVEQKAAFQLAR